MTSAPSPFLLISDLLRALRTRWLSVAFAGTFVMTLVGLYYVAVPRSYVSEGKLYVQVGRGMVSADRVGGTEETVSVVETRSSEVNSIIDLLTSRGLSERVVDRIGPSRILESHSPALDNIKMPSFSSGDSEHDRLMERDAAIRHLMANLDVKNPREAVTISIRCTLGSPELAQEVVATMMSEYLDSHVIAHQTEGSYDFFNSEYERQLERVTEAGAAVRDFKKTNKIMDIALMQKALREQISLIESAMVTEAASLANAAGRAEALDRRIEEAPLEVNAERTEGFSNLAADQMRAQLFAVEIEYRSLAELYDESHPDVKRKAAELAELQAIYDTQHGGREQSTQRLNPIIEALSLDLNRVLTDEVGFQAKLDFLSEQLAKFEARLEALNEQELELAELNFRLDEAKQYLQDYARKREEARVNLALDEERISNVSIWQHATFEMRAENPRLGKTAVLGAFMAGAFGVFVGLLRHHWPTETSVPTTVAQQDLDETETVAQADNFQQPTSNPDTASPVDESSRDEREEAAVAIGAVDERHVQSAQVTADLASRAPR